MSHRNERPLLRTFLERLLDDAGYKGIQWINKGESTFQINWIHGNNPHWTQEDGQIFMEWAKYKGRYKQREDGSWPDPDYTNWKANFRCAVNKCTDVQELPGSGKVNKSIRTYKLLPRGGQRNGDQHPLPAEQTEPKDYVTLPNFDFNLLDTDTFSTVVFPDETVMQYVPETVQNIMETSPPQSLGEGASNYTVVDQVGDLNTFLQLEPAVQVNDNVHRLMDISSQESMIIDTQPTASMMSLPTSLSLVQFSQTPTSMDMCVWIRYGKKLVTSVYVRNEIGCRIWNGNEQNSSVENEVLGAKLLVLPNPEMHPDMTHTGPGDLDDIKLLLERLSNGLHIRCDQSGDIFATRLTSCRIFHANPTLRNAATPASLPRKAPIKVFDRNTFLQKFLDWDHGKGGPRPEVSVLFSIGETWSINRPINKCHISVQVVHAQSWHQITRAKRKERTIVDFLSQGSDFELCT